MGAQIVAESDVAACVMHMKGSPKNMQSEPIYTNVVDEVKKFLISRISVLQALGVRKDKIIVDPGIGFGKSFEHNIAIIKDLGKFAELECPLLIGLSRKSWLKGIIDRPAENRLHGSVAAALIAVQKGVNILRVHDVGATRDALLVQDKLLAEDD